MPNFFGGPEATLIEPIYRVAYWLLENQDYAIFKTPRIPVPQRAEQMEAANYVH